MTGRRTAVVVAALVVLLGVVVAVSTGRRDAPADAPAAWGHWRVLPSSPLSARAGAHVVATGQGFVVVGGTTRPCTPDADCAELGGLSDGARYDPATDTWRSIASSPVMVRPSDRLVRAGPVLVLLHNRGYRHTDWLRYDVAADRWSPMTPPPVRVTDLPAALGPRLYVVGQGRVLRYDVRRDTWHRLPRDPIRPALRGRVVTATPVGPVVTGLDATKPQDGSVRSTVIADVYDGHRWRRLPETGQVGDSPWLWNGTRMVEPEPYTGDGGLQNGWGHRYPVGGSLDPRTGAWDPLPAGMRWQVPDDRYLRSLEAVGDRWVTTYGRVFDSRTGRVGSLPVPAGWPDFGVTGAWAGDRLLAFGGADLVASSSEAGPLSDRAWLWTP